MITWSVAIVLVAFIAGTTSVLHSWLEKRHKRKKMELKHKQDLDKKYLDQ